MPKPPHALLPPWTASGAAADSAEGASAESVAHACHTDDGAGLAAVSNLTRPIPPSYCLLSN